ncbi:MAG: hypothetical protein MUF50_02370 [Planctomycetes bacterium]|jgi:hypothetical protein|nr:hypothetical protein [Planctomycetota bacterium]
MEAKTKEEIACLCLSIEQSQESTEQKVQQLKKLIIQIEQEFPHSELLKYQFFETIKFSYEKIIKRSFSLENEFLILNIKSASANNKNNPLLEEGKYEVSFLYKPKLLFTFQLPILSSQEDSGIIAQELFLFLSNQVDVKYPCESLECMTDRFYRSNLPEKTIKLCLEKKKNMSPEEFDSELRFFYQLLFFN